jgi:cytochrome c5
MGLRASGHRAGEFASDPVMRLAWVLFFAASVSGCGRRDQNRIAAVTEASDRPEALLPGDLATRSDSALLVRHDSLIDTDEEAQPDTLGALPPGVTLDLIREGDQIFHNAGGCENCHGTEAQGLPARGKTLTAGVSFIPPNDWNAIDSVINVGIPDAITRSPIAMPPRGQHSDLSAADIRAVASYVWAISTTKGEPWTGGHVAHAHHDSLASARTSIP